MLYYNVPESGVEIPSGGGGGYLMMDIFSNSTLGHSVTC